MDTERKEGMPLGDVILGAIDTWSLAYLHEAEQGDPMAISMVAQCYLRHGGYGVLDQNRTEGLKWVNKMVDLRLRDSEYIMQVTELQTLWLQLVEEAANVHEEAVNIILVSHPLETGARMLAGIDAQFQVLVHALGAKARQLADQFDQRCAMLTAQKYFDFPPLMDLDYMPKPTL